MNYIKPYIHKFKRWLKFEPPWALSGHGWKDFNAEFKREAPIRFWFHRRFKHIFIYPIKWKYEAMTSWIRYRTTEKYHIVDTGLTPSYYDADTIILNVNFNILKEFVECELACRQRWDSDIVESLVERYMPFYGVFFPFRCPELGLKHLAWEATLDSPLLPLHQRCDRQAVSAREILALYKWWVEDRPARIEICRPNTNVDMLDSLEDINEPMDDGYRKYIEDQNRQSTEWDAEDTDMLVRLIKIRRSLWT